MLVCSCSCSLRGNPEADFDDAHRNLIRGQLVESQNQAGRGFNRFIRSDPAWALKFKILEGRALLEQGRFEDALKASTHAALKSANPDTVLSADSVSAIALIHMRRLDEATKILDRDSEQCEGSSLASCGDVLQALGILADEQSQSATANEMYIRSLAFARVHGDRFLEANSLLNLGYVALAQGHFDEAIERSEAAHQSATNIEARVIALVAQGNIGWAAYRLGDSEKALVFLLQAEKTAADLGDIFDRENLLTNIGYIYMDQRNFDLAARTFQRALILAKSIQAKQDTYNALRVLAKLAVQTGDLDKADDYAQQALTLAADNHVDKLYPILVQGQVAAQRRDFAKARQILETVERDSASPIFLKWEAEHSLARLYQSQNEYPEADSEYRAAIATFEAARATVQSEEFQLSFRTNAARIYDDYVHFLVDNGRSVEALRWADYSRARSLLEGLGLLSNSADTGKPRPSDIGAQEIARRAKGALFFYWLGESQSYLWVVTEQKTALFPLPPGAQIDAMVQRYGIALKGPQDVLATSDDGRALYRTLVAPARALLPNNAKVVIIPDGSLNNLNFETLIVPDPEPHYWIEDASVTNSSSLRVLAASFARDSVHKKKSTQKLLLIGNSVAPSREYPELPHAAEQMADVAKHFPEKRQQIYQGNLATPSSYLGTDVADFSHIHFVAHGTASRLSPLDSAIVLSKPGPDSDSFKLYARDIIRHPLHADLVTISACYGAGERAYSGEGLVGLAWAFLRAGAHNVIAALWDVTDASTEQLMDRFYDELEKGSNPEDALRAAKLSLLRGNTFRNPFYWAPFQLYAGSDIEWDRGLRSGPAKPRRRFRKLQVSIALMRAQPFRIAGDAYK